MSRRIPAELVGETRARFDRLLGSAVSVVSVVSTEPTPHEAGWLPGAPGAPDDGVGALIPWIDDVPKDEATGDDAKQDEVAPPAPGARHAIARGARLKLRLEERLPASVRGALLVAERPAITGLAVLGLATVSLAMIVWGLGRPHAQAVAPRVLGPGAVATAGATGRAAFALARPSAPPLVVVQVAGLVRHPGVVELPAGSRVQDALRAAGGARPKADLTAVNLARKLVDGEQIVLVQKGQHPAAAGGAGTTGAPGDGAATGAGPSNSGPIDLNAATLQQLDGLPGVGPVLAQRILDWRTQHQRFSSVDELHEVTGIGESRFRDLAPLVTV